MRITVERNPANAWTTAGRAVAGVLLALVLTTAIFACGNSKRAEQKRPDGPLRVVVSLPPLLGLVQALASEIGPDVKVQLVVPVGAMEHGFEIPPSMVSGLAQADVVVYVGLGLGPQIEKLLREKRSHRHEVCFADAVGITDDGHHHHHDHGHDHDHDHDHAHGSEDPHLWLDPSLVARFVPAIAAALADAAAGVGNTEAAARLRDATNGPGAALARRVADMDAEYEDRLRPHRGGVVITAHAAWGRLTDRYGLEQSPLAGLEANEPSPAAIARAADLVKQRRSGAIFSEPQINPAAVNRVADLTGAKVFQLDPLGDGDWFKMMRTNLDTLVAGLGTAK